MSDLERGERNAKLEVPGVVVLYDVSERLVKGEPCDMLAEQSAIGCSQAVADALRTAGYRVVELPIYTDLEPALAPYPPTDWVVFNLVEGLEGRLFEAVRVAWALDAMGYRFTGSPGAALACSTHKAQAKALMEANDVAVPPWRVFRHPSEVDGNLAPSLLFPLIVKPLAEDASLGISREAVVYTGQELRERVAYVVKRYRQAALAETFIVGREFNISLWGDPPEVLPLSEIDFNAIADPYARLFSFAAKWEEDSFEYQHMPDLCPATVDPDLRESLTAIALRSWTAIGCRGYARMDVRVSSEGIPYVLEVNCNPYLLPGAGFHRAARAAGYDYQDMVVTILQLAWR